MKKTIALYLNGLSHSGGMERVVSNLVRQWIIDYDIILITKDDGSCFYSLPEGVNKVSLSIPMNMDMTRRLNRIKNVAISLIKSPRLLRKIFKKIQFDYLYVTNPLNAFEVYLADKLIVKDKMVISEHASINAFNSIYTWMKRKVYPEAYYLSVPNSMDTPIYKEWGCNAVYIPHMLSFPIEKSVGIREKVVLNVGRFTSDKQQLLLLKIWARIKDKKGWKLWILGDGEERQAMEEYIELEKLTNEVRLMHSRKDIQAIYKQVSLFALTSRCEGFGMVLLEAMSFGIPCISFDCPSGPRDVVKDGINGFLIENGNEFLFQERLQEMISMQEDRFKTFSYGAYDTVEKWDNQEILEQWKKIFK